ncbi:polysaccharide biosynthesis/export family protein [Sedimentitalea sp. XS_ASV28]|uniref:polysaccharide biosynthesis/export family protein n=1 Tax=Sedimentitalea sp. XS_ASV28 TaxID=3241296 RepID=UPI003513A8D3
MQRFIALIVSLVVMPLFASQALAQSSYKIKSGDVLRIEVLEDSSLNGESIVLPDGRASVPLVGTVPVRGRSVDEVRNDLVARLRPNFASDPTVYVSLSSVATDEPEDDTLTIYMLGEVTTPGTIEVERGTTFLQALAQGGGVTRFGATKRLQLRRPGANGQMQVYTFNVKAIMDGKSSVNTPVLREGDIIIVPQRRLFE